MRVLFSGFKGHKPMGTLYTPFDDVLARADIITLHCPLSDETRNMIGAAEFAKMQRKPLLINTARGGLVGRVHGGDPRWKRARFPEQALMWSASNRRPPTIRS